MDMRTWRDQASAHGSGISPCHHGQGRMAFPHDEYALAALNRVRQVGDVPGRLGHGHDMPSPYLEIRHGSGLPAVRAGRPNVHNMNLT